MFFCDKCGLCCMNISKSDIYQHLDRGDGICKYFNEITKLCNIYETRPVICNIDGAYKNFFCNYISIEEYYQLNYDSCNELKRQFERDKLKK